MNSGLANNGGSRTILLSSQILTSIGHRCDVVSLVDNFTWFDHKPTITFIPNDFDAIINIAAVDYEITKSTNIPIKTAWWRGHETWSNNESFLRYCYTDTAVRNLVNSRGLQRLLAAYGADSHVLYQGIDFDLWEDKKLRSDQGSSSSRLRIGCLYQKKKTKRWKDFIALAKVLGYKDYEYVGFGYDIRSDDFLTEYKQDPSRNDLIDLYSSCHIWFAPTEQEGLHNVPIEAALCGCLVVCSDHPMNGMGFDYAFGGNTVMVYEARNIGHAAELIKNPNWEVIDRMYNHLMNNIASRETNMKKLVEYIKET